jgi:ABC-type transport system involved in multi-copper enzyme maturation permease subunit
MLIAGSTALVVASLSMCVSVWSARARDATVRVYAVLAALVLLPLGMYPLFGLAWGGMPLAANAERVWRALLDLNPLVVLTRSMSSGAALGLGLDLSLITRMAGWHAALAGVGLLIATVAVRRIHLREATRGEGRRFKLPRLSLPRWKPPLGDRPMVWKELFAENVKIRLGFVGRVAIGLLVAWVLVFSGWIYWNALTRGGGWNKEEYLWSATGMIELVGCATLLLLAARAASQVAAERERDTWLSLISTPLSGSEIVAGKLLGNLYAARWSLLLMLVVALPALTFNFSAILPLAGCLAVFALLATFVSLWGLAGSLKSPSTLRAMGIALGATLFLGGGYLTCCCPVIMGGASGDEMMIMLAPCMPFLMWMPVALYVGGPNSSESFYGGMALLLGVVGYAVASVALARTLIAQFDAWAGRTGDRPEAPEGTVAPQ